MNISLTSDDIVAAVTVGGVVLTPVVGYIKFVHGQQAAIWRGFDKLKENQNTYVTRDDQEKYRLELKADLMALEGRLIKEMDRLVGHRGNA